MKITKELLIKKGACNEGISWFEEHYPNGVSVTAKAISECKDCPTGFIWWFYNNVSKDDRLLALCGVNWSYDVNGSYGVNWSNGVDSSNGVNWSCGVNRSDGVNRSYGVNGSNGVNESDSVNESHGVDSSNGVNESHGVNWSYGVNWSTSVNGSTGVNESNGVNNSFGILNSCGVDCALFLANKPRTYTIFGKEVSEKYFSDVRCNLMNKLNHWRPTFNNIKSLYLKSGSDWIKTPIKDAKEISKREAWADMPKEAIDYIKSLPEFDADIFTEITGIEV